MKVKQKLMERKPKLVVAVLVRNGNKYLLVREILEDGKSWWIVPGGKVEFGEKIEDAARRELEEETGIRANGLKFLCFKEAIAEKYNYHTVIFFYETVTNSEKVDKDIEGKVIEASWFTKTEALKLPLVDSAKWLFNEVI